MIQQFGRGEPFQREVEGSPQRTRGIPTPAQGNLPFELNSLLNNLRNIGITKENKNTYIDLQKNPVTEQITKT